MAARKAAAKKTTPVQTKASVKEETVKVEKKTAAVEAEAPVAEAAPAAEAVEVKVEKTEKKVAEKKPAAKRTTKKAVKTSFVVQAAGKEVSMEETIERVKEAWTATGNKEADLKEISVYVKPEEKAIYYVVNGEVTGRVDF